MAKGLAKKKEKKTQAREYTINIAYKTARSAYKKRAPRAIKAIKKFASKEMGTKDVRIDVGLNEAVWGRGISRLPRRVRVRLVRKLNENDDAKETHYTLVTHVQVPSFKGLTTQVVADE